MGRQSTPRFGSSAADRLHRSLRVAASQSSGDQDAVARALPVLATMSTADLLQQQMPSPAVGRGAPQNAEAAEEDDCAALPADLGSLLGFTQTSLGRSLGGRSARALERSNSAGSPQVESEDGGTVRLPRRRVWDLLVRVGALVPIPDPIVVAQEDDNASGYLRYQPSATEVNAAAALRAAAVSLPPVCAVLHHWDFLVSGAPEHFGQWLSQHPVSLPPLFVLALLKRHLSQQRAGESETLAAAAAVSDSDGKRNILLPALADMQIRALTTEARMCMRAYLSRLLLAPDVLCALRRAQPVTLQAAARLQLQRNIACVPEEARPVCASVLLQVRSATGKEGLPAKE